MNYCFLQEFFMKCRFCEQDVKPVGHNLVSAPGDIVCTQSPTKKLVAVYDGDHCIHCGRQVSILGDRIVTSAGISCPASPSGRHVVR